MIARATKLGWWMFALAFGSGALASNCRASDDGWIDLSALDAWKAPGDGWRIVGGIGLDFQNPKRFRFEPGEGILVNGPQGNARNLVSHREFGDVEVHLEFAVPRRSNSGVKLEGLYEVQIFDSWGVEEPKGSDCGGIYPRAEFKPKYHHIDEGFPPSQNACRPPGEWQTLDIVFLAPRFDSQGNKTANARFVKVDLNGQTVQEDLELKYPTGHAWHKTEPPTGPLLLQADHGPVAFRNVRVRPSTRDPAE